jgi:adenylate kinase family enzyme
LESFDFGAGVERTVYAAGRMRRVAIVGCGGAGKSLLAQELGRRLGIAVVHLDSLYWGSAWQPRPSDEWEKLQRRLVERETWIIDGNYGATMQLRLAAADTVIYLDLPTRVCLRRVLLRRLKHPGRARAELAGAERLNLAFIRWIWTYRRDRRLRVLERLATLDARTNVVTLTSRTQVRRFLHSLPATPRPPTKMKHDEPSRQTSK